MTEPVDSPLSGPPEARPQAPREEVLPDAMATQYVVQQLRDAGFSDTEQVALTTAFLRVLALWTQQVTRSDLQTALHEGEQRLAQQLEALREELRRGIPTSRRAVPMWLLTVLLGLTCAGVLLLVIHQLLRW